MLNSSEETSVLYHDLFDYPLSFSDLIKWRAGKQFSFTNFQFSVTNKRGFYFLKGREGLIYKRLTRKRISAKKMAIALKASKVLSFIPTVRMVGVTGSLAMENSGEDSDIDLIIIVKQGTLWTTRLLVYLLFVISHLSFRRPFDKNQKDALCLNMWLDESDLVWPKNDRNLYTAHEIAQIVPLINKTKTYEKFLFQNKWILSYWPNSVRINEKLNTKSGDLKTFPSSFFYFPLIQIERLAFKLQYEHMKSKMTREVVIKTRALFHPNNWGKIVLEKLSY